MLLVGLGVSLAGGVQASASLPFERIILVAPPGDTREDAAIVRWQQRWQQLPTAAALEQLGWAFVAKARATLDDGYYSLAAATADVLARQPDAVARAHLLQGHVLHQLHRFAEAEALARQLVAAHAGPEADALLSDVLMEQGRLPEAVAACQRFVDARPGLEAFARIAHLRWLTGDLAGATRAMQDAVAAGAGRSDTSLPWALTRLAGYRLQQGEARAAASLADSALATAPDYPPALLVRGRVLLAEDRAAEAAACFVRAADLVPFPEYQWWALEALRVAGDESAAVRWEKELLRHGATADPRTTALFLATHDREPARALALATAELAERRDVFTHDAVAWAALSAGDLDAAKAAIADALRPGTVDARLFLHAGAIARAAGRAADARSWLTRAAAHAATLLPTERTRLARETAALSALPVAVLSLPPRLESTHE